MPSWQPSAPPCPRMVPDRPSRVRLAAAAVIVTGVGLVVATSGSGQGADAAGDVLYAVLVYLVLAFCAPGARRALLASTAFGLCALVELAQLTGVPAALVDLWAPVRYLLGTTFNAVDLLAYSVGVVLGAGAHTVLRRGVAAQARP